MRSRLLSFCARLGFAAWLVISTSTFQVDVAHSHADGDHEHRHSHLHSAASPHFHAGHVHSKQKNTSQTFESAVVEIAASHSHCHFYIVGFQIELQRSASNDEQTFPKCIDLVAAVEQAGLQLGILDQAKSQLILGLADSLPFAARIPATSVSFYTEFTAGPRLLCDTARHERSGVLLS